MLSIPSSRPLEPADYQWNQSRESPTLWQRRALANECMWLARPKDSRDLFIYASLALKTPILCSALSSATKSAWQQLRYEVPELALKGAYQKDGKAYMQYQTPQAQDISQWIERTTAFDFGEQHQGFEQLRENVLKKRGHHADNVFLFSRALVGAGNFAPARSVELLIYVDHQVTDGIGARILLGRYLALLASSITTSSNPPECKFDWQESHNKLSSPWISFMNDSQELSGAKYDETASWNQEILTEKIKHNRGVPLLEVQRPETQENHSTALSETLSGFLLEEIKKEVGCDSNITHLGHAAMVLALLRANPLIEPLSTQPLPLYSPCWLNGRRYLLSSVAHPAPTKDYIPLCLSFAPIIFPDLRAFSLPRSAEGVAIKPMLVEACKIATAEYQKIKMRTSMLPECVALFESFGESMRAQQQTPTSAGRQQYASPKDDVEPKFPLTAEPFFLSDGITEQYIDHRYFARALRARKKKLVFEVDDVKFAANAERNLIVRMSSWKGQIVIAGEWRGCDYNRRMAVGFLEDTKKIMLSIFERE